MSASDRSKSLDLDPGATGSERHLGRDALGLLLFAFAVLLGVSVFLSLARPAEAPEGTTAFFTGLAGLLGAWPLFALSLGLAVLGARLWVTGVAHGLLRHVLGAGLTTLSLSILAGAIYPGAGGTVGAWAGGAITSELSIFVGAPAGLLAIGLSVWLVWVRPADGSQRTAVPRFAPDEGLAAESEGLSADEAAALLPGLLPGGGPQGGFGGQPEPRTPPDAPRAAITGRSIPISPELPPLYPPDVRLQGGIPEGTQPLDSPENEPSAPKPMPAAGRSPASLLAGPGGLTGAGYLSLARGGDLSGASEPSTLRRGSASPVPDPQRPAGPDLASPADLRPLWEQDEEAQGLNEDQTPLLIVADTEPDGFTEHALADHPGDPTDRDPQAAEGERILVAEAEGPLDRASWEQPGLFDEEPVDAYGTPLSLIEKLRTVEIEPPGTADVAAEPGAFGASATAHPDEIEHPAGADSDAPETQVEPEVVLSPRSKPKARGSKRPSRAKNPVDSGPKPAPETVAGSPQASGDLVYRAGVLFLERGRVAVSLLQREFSLDFKQATALLDRLQEAGLIGPYLGGQRRDILLTLEEWRERVGVS